jgi:hypothetical protein
MKEPIEIFEEYCIAETFTATQAEMVLNAMQAYHDQFNLPDAKTMPSREEMLEITKEWSMWKTTRDRRQYNEGAMVMYDYFNKQMKP